MWLHCQQWSILIIKRYIDIKNSWQNVVGVRDMMVLIISLLYLHKKYLWKRIVKVHFLWISSQKNTLNRKVLIDTQGTVLYNL